MVQLTDLDELLAHQIPQPFPAVAQHHEHWRESYFFIVHHPARLDDVVILTMATYPGRQVVDSLQMGRVAGERVGGLHVRPYDGDPHTPTVGPVHIEVVRPYEEIRFVADHAECNLGMDLTFRARTKPYGLRRGTMRAGDDVVWDQSHMFQSGTCSGTYTVGGVTRTVEDWWCQRDHSWGIRDHGRCPLWLWFQVQLPDGFLGVWHWELANGARVFTDGCWAPSDGSEPVPLVDFAHDVRWTGVDGGPVAYGEHGDDVVGLQGAATFVLADGRRVTVEGDGRFDNPYEPFHRGGLNQMVVRTDDGRQGTAIFEVTGAPPPLLPRHDAARRPTELRPSARWWPARPAPRAGPSDGGTCDAPAPCGPSAFLRTARRSLPACARHPHARLTGPRAGAVRLYRRGHRSRTMRESEREELAMEWDLGLWGVAYLLAMSVAFGVVAHLIAGRATTRWLWLIATAAFFVVGLFISEVLFGWATEEELQPNIDGLSRDEVLLGTLPGLATVLLARRWGLRRHGRLPGAPKPA